MAGARWFTPSTPTPKRRVSRRCCERWESTASTSKPCTHARARSKTFSSSWWEPSHERPRYSRNLRLRDGAHLPNRHAEHCFPGDLDQPLFRGVRVGHRLAHGPGRRSFVRSLHHSGAHHDVAPEREHIERVVRHLHAQVG